MLASVRHYRVVRPLGAGGMGEVYLAQDTRLDRSVALKLLAAESAGSQDLAALPFYDSKKMSALLDQLPRMTEAGQVAWDPVLMSVLNACVLRKRFNL